MAHYNYIMIGAGSAGCVVVNCLAENSDTTVLLLEAGNPDTKSEIYISSEFINLLGFEVNWAYFFEPEPYLNNRKMFCPRGKVLGGSSAIDFMLYVRGNHHDYGHWQPLGNSGWSYQGVLPYFKKSKHQQQRASEYHGVDGELSITDIKPSAVVSQRFIDACVAMGYDYNPDFNGTQQEGAEPYHLTVKDGKRHSTATAFLLPILQDPNLTTMATALVTRLLFVVGVEYLQEGTLHQVRVNSEVILSAGAFDFPKLLMLSGIGNADYLQTLGLVIAADLPGVGQNLQDYLLFPVVYEATQDVHPHITSNGVEVGLFLHSESNLETAADLQFFFAPILFFPPGHARLEFRFTSAVSLNHLQNIGGAGLRSLDLEDASMFRMNYLQSEVDVQKLVAAIGLMRQFLHSNSFNRFRGKEIALGINVKSVAALAADIRESCSTVYHAVNTCKMGIDSMAVVDSELRVDEIEGLRVVDASIMPTIVTGNTNAATIVIAEKAADLIKASRTRQTLLTKHSIKNPNRLAYLRIRDREW